MNKAENEKTKFINNPVVRNNLLFPKTKTTIMFAKTDNTNQTTCAKKIFIASIYEECRIIPEYTLNILKERILKNKYIPNDKKK